jgi:hypothetical protein
LSVLKAEQYEVVSIAGGEPLVYPGLARLAAAAVTRGYRVHVVTNGLLLSRERVMELRDFVDLVAVSFDGAEATHNLVRGRCNAFAKANAALELLATEGVPFGLIFGVSQRSLPDVPWAFERAQELGASLLHLHPLVAEGRGKTLAPDWMLGPAECARLFVLGKLLAAGVDRPHIQVDLVARNQLEDARVQYAGLTSSEGVAVLSDIVNPLVIDDLGRCLAFTYNIHHRFTIANLAGTWRQELADACDQAHEPISRLVNSAFRTAHQQEFAYFDWFEHLTRLSHRIGPAVDSAGSWDDSEGETQDDAASHPSA